jgi:hypothetical protein
MKAYIMDHEIVRSCPPNKILISGAIIVVRHGKDGSQRAGVVGENPVQRAFLHVKKWKSISLGWTKAMRISRDDVLGIVEPKVLS